MRSLRSAFVLFLLAAFLGGCAPELGAVREGYGLRPVEIRLREEDQAQLLHGGMSKTHALAELRIEKERYAGEVSLSGQGTLTHIKKSYTFKLDDPHGPIPFRALKFSAQAQD